MLYFEEIEPGTTAAFGRYEVTREEIIEFATKYDPQPFHLSDEGAAETHFGKLAASGWHTCAMMMRMLIDSKSVVRETGLGSPGLDELRWIKPVYPGDILRCETQILDKRPSRSRADMGSFRTNTTVFNQDDVAVMTCISIGLVRRQPAAG